MRSGYQHMVLDYYVGKTRAMREERVRRLQAIRTRKDAERYQDEVRAAIGKAFRPRPRETTLRPRITGVLERRGYRIEKVIFESRPGCFVTANLYVPNRLDGPAPGVIGSCGHSEIAKAEPRYQEFAQRLVQAGFVVLIYDPFNQGERDQYFRLPADEPVRRDCCHAHNMMGKQLELVGEYFGMWRAWDGIRALDYLLTRPEVDPARIGLTGNSGGGTMTTWTWAVEDRFTMAAPSCFVTTFVANLENEIPADSEQYPPGVLGAGLEMVDFMIARAPAPAILLGQKYCFFDRRGFLEAAAEMERFYRLLGAPDNAAHFLGNNVHGYYPDNQKAMVDFFCRHAGAPAPRRFIVAVEEPQTLWATSAGEVVADGSKPIYEILGEQAAAMSARRKRLSGPELRRKLTALLQLPPRRDVPHFRILRPDSRNGELIARYAVETEGEIRAILHKRLVERSHAGTLDVEKAVNLFLPHTSSAADMAEDPLAKSLLSDSPLYALDVRGLGESMPDESGDFFHPYGMDYMFHGHGLLFGESYLGRRVHDVLRTIDLLVDEGAQKVQLYGRGQGAILALFTGLLHPAVKSVTLKNGPLSCLEWTQCPVVAWPSANFLRGLLKVCDLPDGIRALGKRVTILEPWGADMQPLDDASIQRQVRAYGIPAESIR